MHTLVSRSCGRGAQRPGLGGTCDIQAVHSRAGSQCRVGGGRRVGRGHKDWLWGVRWIMLMKGR